MVAELLLRYLSLSQGLRPRKRGLHSQVLGGRHTATTRHSLPGMWGLEPRSMHRGVCCHRSPPVCTLSHEHLRQQCAHQSKTGLWCTVVPAHCDEGPRSRRRVGPYSMGMFSLKALVSLKIFRSLKALRNLKAFVSLIRLSGHDGSGKYFTGLPHKGVWRVGGPCVVGGPWAPKGGTVGVSFAHIRPFKERVHD